MKRALICLFAVAVVFLVGIASYAAELTVDEVVNKANEAAYYAGNDGKTDISMTITDSQGRERVREFTILRMNSGTAGEQKFYVYFKKPEDVREMVYMVWKHLGSDDDRWMYLPALDLVKRVAASDKRSSFVGSDFVYEDVSGRGIKEDIHEMIESTNEYYKLKNTPKDKKSVEFSHFFLWVDKITFLPSKAEYYDKQGQLYRIVESLKVKTIQGYPTVVSSKVSNLESGGNTISTFNKIQYDIGLSDDIFTERYLRRSPRKWIE